MNSLQILIYSFSLILSITTAQDVDPNQVRCLVCRTVVDEFKHEVSKIDPLAEIEIGQYRLDNKGNTINKKVPLSMSEVHLSDLLESICKKMEDYVRARHKSNGKLTLMKLMVDNGVNPAINEVDIVQDGDLNKSLEFYCTSIINDHEDTFIEVISKKERNAKVKICSEEAEYCTNFIDDSADDDDEDRSEDDEQNDHEYDKTEL